jgi:hypothetical protein
MEVYETSDILIISLKRFDGNMQKLENLIRFPLVNLDLTDFVKGKLSLI